MDHLFDLLKRAIQLEGSTTPGRINLVFGIIAVGLIAVLYAAEHLLEKIGDFLLRLFGRVPGPKSESDKLFAFISLLCFFVISLVLVTLFSNLRG